MSFRETNCNNNSEDGPSGSKEYDQHLERNKSPTHTVHRAREDGTDRIPITDGPLQFFKRQILIINGDEFTCKDYSIIHKILGIIESDPNYDHNYLYKYKRKSFK